MKFETNKDVLDWFERQPRALTKEFIDGIKWREVKNYPLDERFVPVLLYMRDIEVLTEMYHEELLRTPTGKDPIISKFMERWGVEEITHGEILNRFLNEAGIPTPEEWKKKARREVSKSYTFNTRLVTALTNLVGREFTATHMSFGAINELSAGQSYRRLMDLANHPVLTYILKGIIREESVHTQFYLSIARLELKRSRFAQKLARFVVDKFWLPVGQGAKSATEGNYMIATLFGGVEGLEWIDKTITQRVQTLPGFGGLTKINETVRDISLRAEASA
jgi:hypothetical protein